MTKPGTAPATDGRPLSEVARHVVAPDGIVATEWPSVSETCRRLGWGFDGWQHGAGRLILSKRSDGSYAADTTCISIPRQAGKTYLIACIIFALCLINPKLTVIWTAHRKTTARETFDQFDGMAQKPKVAAHIRQVLHGKGDEAVHFNNGSRILFGARESGFGRGFAGVDILVADEGQILPESVLEDLGATQNTAPNPLFFVMGTPPRPRDQGEFFTLLRSESLNGESDSTLYIETSADRGTDPMDPDQLRKANPSHPHRTSYRALLRLRKKLKNNDAWNREARGIWDDTANVSVFSSSQWSALEDSGPESNVRPTSMAVDMSHGRSISVSACWRDDDSYHVEEVWRGWDALAAAAWVGEAARRASCVVVVDNASPAMSLVPDIKAAKCKVIQTGSQDMVKACGHVESLVHAGLLTHSGQETVSSAVAAGFKRPIRDAGGWGWDRRDETANIAPLVAATLSVFGASIAKRTSGAVHSF